MNSEDWVAYWTEYEDLRTQIPTAVQSIQNSYSSRLSELLWFTSLTTASITATSSAPTTTADSEITSKATLSPTTSTPSNTTKGGQAASTGGAEMMGSGAFGYIAAAGALGLGFAAALL